MKTILTILLAGFVTVAHTQDRTFERKGFVFGASIGISSSRLAFANQPAQRGISASLPNFKTGAMVAKRMAVLLYLPGTLYDFKNEGRVRDRGFEAITPSVQYWWNHRTWVLGGVGIGLDAPAFYDIKQEEERKFYFGKAAVAAIGYEIWQKGNFALDIQSRIHYGTANRPEGKINGLAFDFLIGFNLY